MRNQDRLPDPGRYPHLDLMKSISVLTIPFMHVVSMTFNEGMNAPSFPHEQIVGVVGLIHNNGPPMFLFSMGCGMVLSRHNSPDQRAARGLRLIWTGLLLNLIRFTPYYLIRGLVLKEYAALPYAWLWLIGSDILPCAGLCMLSFSAFLKRKLSAGAILCVGILVALSQLFLPVPRLSGMAGQLLGNFIYVEGGGSYFPVVSWLLFPCLGYFYQTVLQKVRHPGRFHLALGLGCTGLLLGSWLLLRRRGKWKPRYLRWGEMGDRMDPPTLWFVSLFMGIYVSVMYGLSALLSRFAPRRVLRCIREVSKRVTSIYVIHWVVLMYSILAAKLRGWNRRVRNVRELLALGTALLGVTLLISQLWTMFKTLRRKG